jgi:hypothetical protein
MNSFKLFIATPKAFYSYEKLRVNLKRVLRNKILTSDIILGTFDTDENLKFFGEDLVDFRFRYQVEVPKVNKYKLCYYISKYYDALLVTGKDMYIDYLIQRFNKESKPIRYI